MNGFTTVLKVVLWFVILTDHTKVLLTFVCWRFQVFSMPTMEEGIRSGKTLSLGMTKAPEGNIKGPQASKLWDALEGIPSFFYQLSVNYLELYFYSSHDMSFAWSITYYMSLWFVCFLVCHNHLCWTHLFERDTHYSWFVRILYVLHLYLLSKAVDLVLHLYLFESLINSNGNMHMLWNWSWHDTYSRGI